LSLIYSIKVRDVSLLALFFRAVNELAT